MMEESCLGETSMPLPKADARLRRLQGSFYPFPVLKSGAGFPLTLVFFFDPFPSFASFKS